MSLLARWRPKPSLLDQIEQDLIAERPLGATLRKCLFLGSHAGSTELRGWASRELNGYFGVATDEIPQYRVITAPLYLDGVTSGYRVARQPISPMELEEYNSGVFDETYVFQDGASQIEDLAGKDDPVKIAPPGAADLAMIINRVNPGQQIERIYWSIAPVAIRGVADGIRSALTEVVAEMRAGLSDQAELPDSELADQAYNIAIKGIGNRVSIAHAESAGGDANVTIAPAGELPGFWTPLRKLWAFAASSASIAGFSVVVAQWQGWIELTP